MGATTCAGLLPRRGRPGAGRRLRFAGVPGRDVYNPTAPFEFGGERLLAARVEARDSEVSQTVFFVAGPDGVWRPRPGAPVFERLQDPCAAFVGGELVLGGVEIELGPGDCIRGWSMPFFRGRRLEDLARFARGPAGMKDIRLLELDGGRIGVAPRPQGEKGGRGTIGWAEFERLEDLNPEGMQDAPLIEGQFAPGEWGGANQLHRLEDGSVGVLGHIACFGPGRPPSKHYYPMAFRLQPDGGAVSPLRVLATRADFPDAPAKRPELGDVVFSAGLVRRRGGRADLYAGLGDAAVARVEIEDPFIGFERDGA